MGWTTKGELPVGRRMVVEILRRRHCQEGSAKGITGEVVIKKVLEWSMMALFYQNGCSGGGDWVDRRKKVVAWKVS